MKLVLNGLRLAFPQIWEPVKMDEKSEAACSASLLMDPSKDAALINTAVECIKAVAAEKWQSQAQVMMTQLQAKGDICLRDGNTKAEYDGFPGMVYISARNSARPTVLAAQQFNGKPIFVDKASNAYQLNEQGMLVRIDNLPFVVKAPYAGCYVNVSLDVWAQANQFGKRINAKLLGIQFARDGDPFSGGAGFDASDFGYTEAAAGGAFGSFGAAPPPAPAASTGSFGFGAAPAPAAGGFSFGAPAPAPAAAGGFSFGAPAAAPAPAPAAGFSFGGAPSNLPF